MFSKIGLLHLPSDRPAWMHSHAYIPSAFLLNPDTIRIVVAFWDDKGIGRAGYLDVAADNPLSLKGFSEHPSLDLGQPGAFDDNGISPLCIVAHEKKLRLYYAGWQLSDKVRYFLFTGLAESADDGVTFTRVKKTPVLERSDQELILRTGGFVCRAGNQWRMFYCAGSRTIEIEGKPVPTYDLKWMDSADGIHWPDHGNLIFAPDLVQGEFAFGRPYVVQEKERWRMWYGIRRTRSGYQLGYAESPDGERWKKKDEAMETFNTDDWPHDNEMRAFPSFVTVASGTYVFYDGNGYGKEGLCVAKLET